MAKEKRSSSDLDAELAALEAELAALEGKPKKAKKAERPAPAPPPAPATPAAPEPGAQEAAPEAKPAKKGRFSLPKLRGKSEPAPEAAPAPAPAPAIETPTPAPREEPAPIQAFAPRETYDLRLWRQEGNAWIRTVPETPVPVMRRVLDDEGNVVREEPASQRDLDEASGVKAERGLGRLLRRK